MTPKPSIEMTKSETLLGWHDGAPSIQLQSSWRVCTTQDRFSTLIKIKRKYGHDGRNIRCGGKTAAAENSGNMKDG